MTNEEAKTAETATVNAIRRNGAATRVWTRPRTEVVKAEGVFMGWIMGPQMAKAAKRGPEGANF
jgi:hypothetical protein